MSGNAFRREGYLREDHRFFHLRDTAGQERELHFHEFDKVVILLSGRVDYTVEGERYALQPWDVLLIKHHTIHRALIDQSEPYDRVILYISAGFADRLFPGAKLAECFQLADRQRQHLLSPAPGDREALARCVKALEQAREDEAFGAGALRDCLMCQLLVLISRMMRSGEFPAGAASPQYDEKISQALAYIHAYPERDLTADEIAEQVYLSKYHFMRLFKAQTGTTVHAYVRQMRLLSAARLIREGEPAGKAAELCGFRDYSSFYRAFRETFGVSPGQLK